MKNKREKSSLAYAEALNLMPGGVNSPVRAFKSVNMDPIFIESGEGALIRDIDGNEYIDYVMSWGPLILGHSHPEVVKGITKTAIKGSSFGAPSYTENQLAKLVLDRLPGMEMIRFVSSGTEAVMSALRVARGVTGRNKILKFVGCYHGHGDSLLIKAGSGVVTHGLPDSPGVPEDTARNTLTADFNNLEEVKDIFRRHGEEIAAVIVEPISGNMGVVLPQFGFLEGLRHLTKEYGALLIFDEVMTGFRVDYGCAQKYFNVTPDMTTLGKIIGGGLPVGAFAGRKEVMEQIAPVGPIYQAGTLSGNPLAMVAGYETLSRLNKSSYEYLEKLGNKLEIGFQEAANKYNIPHTVNRVGSMLCFFFTNEKVIDYTSAKTSNLKLFAEFFKLMINEGIYLPPSQFEGLFISTAHTEDHITKTVNAFHTVFEILALKNEKEPIF